MLQTAVISDNAKAIVIHLLWEVRKKNFLSEPHRIIIVSLYSTMPQAKPEITELFSQLKVDLLNFITKEDLDILKSEYSDVIQYCYEAYGRDGSFYVRKDNNNSWAPKGLIDLCLSIAQPEDGASIYLPYSGEAQFGYYLPNCNFEGFETETLDWAFSQILLDSKGVKSDIALVDLDKISQTTKEYNYIFTIPPFANGRELKERFIINQLYHLATQSLKPNGEMYCILPMAFCNASHGWFDLRKILLDRFRQYSTAVISLPKVFYPLTNINVCLFVLIKDNNDKVILMDASGSEFFATHDIAGYTDVELKVESIIETINKQDEQYMWVGYPTELTDGLNLTPSRYLVNRKHIHPKRGEKIVQLKDLIEIVPRERFDVPVQGYKLIDTKLLSKSYINCEIKNQDVELVSLPKPTGMRARILSDNDCLLFAHQFGKSFVGRLSGFSNKTVVAISGFTIPFKLKSNLKSNLISEDFILRTLISDDIIKQLNMLNGSMSEKTQESDFLSLRILLPSYEEQIRLCKEDTYAGLREADKKILESAESFRRDIHMVKHSIGQTVFNLNNWMDVLMLAREQGDGVVSDNDIIGKNHKVKVADIYTQMQLAIEQLQAKLFRFDRGGGLVAKNTALTDVIENYIASHKSPLFEFEYDATTHRSSTTIPEVDIDETTGVATTTGRIVLNEGDPIEYAVCSPEAIEIVLDNIINNACSHGFAQRENVPNIIKIELKLVGNDYVISVSNNGTPLSDEMSQEDVFAYGESTQFGKKSGDTTHFGLGGYEIKSLMQQFDGDVEIISTPQEMFTVTYNLIFHNTSIISIEL